ncbi:MAG: radical SAM protein [bacterium]|nr:radical SAM protein [bacterium]
MKRIFSGIRALAAISAVKLGGRIPFYCEWEITDCCTMNCWFCGTRNTARPLSDGISTGDALRTIDSLSGLGCGIIHFSGGEPTLRTDLGDLIRSAKKKGIITAVTTNGSGSEHSRNYLLAANLVMVSIDGPEDFHDRGRDCPGAFRKALETVKYLLSQGKKPVITAVYTRGSSYRVLQELAGLAGSLGVKLSVKNQGRNVNASVEETLADHATGDLNSTYYRKFLETVGRLSREFGSMVECPDAVLMAVRLGGLSEVGCRAMDIAVSIKADGRISFPCNGLSISLLAGDLKNIYYGEQARAVRRFQGAHPVCDGCTIPCMAQASALVTLRGLVKTVGSYGNRIT